MDISPIFERPDFTEKVKLIITPLAPLSMVSEIPGSYYKSDTKPSKIQVAGLLENLLGWHISFNDRVAILKDVRTKYKKAYKIDGPNNSSSGSTYQSLILHLFEIGVVLHSKPDLQYAAVVRYDDVWKKMYRRSDAIVHPNGTPNIDFELIKAKRALKRKDDKPHQIDDTAMEHFFKENLGRFPFYYTTVSKREHLIFDGIIQIALNMQRGIFHLLKTAAEENNLVYLGTSDGWIDVKIEVI